jgi:signal transduction histidine kinase
MYRELCIVTLNIASCYIEINQFDSAKYYLISGLEMAEKYNLRNEKLHLYQAMGILMSKTGNFKSAFEYQQSYIALYDSIYNSEKDKMVADITGKYEIEQKEKENELLRQQNTIKQLQVEKTTNKLKYLFLIALVIILSITVFLWMLIRSNKARKETNKILEGKNRQIVLQKDQLVETLHFLSQREHNLAEANATKDRFFSIIAHDLKNPFTGILGFSKILNDDFDQLSEAEQRQYISYINESSDQLYKLLDNLLQWARAQLNQIDPKPEQIAIGRLVNNCVLLYKNIARNKNIHIEYDPRCNLTAYADPGMMETIMRNLLSNAIKFSPHDGVIKISASKVGKHTEITVSDSGIGMSDEEQLKLFKIDVRLQKKGTASEQGSGLGLIICKEFVERNHGSVRLQSKKGVGSQFTITLPEG